jgi:predicted Fe-Mo cluster-binding NifX family protein
MLLAIGLDGNNVASNFGLCNDFRLVEIVDGKVVSIQDFYNDVNTHKQRPPFLKSIGVDVLIMNGLGATAYDLLVGLGIKCINGQNLSAEEALNAYLNNNLTVELESVGPHCS